MLPQRKKETTIRPQCNIFPVFTYQIQYIKPQTSFQNTWNWIMASKQVAQTRRHNTSPQFQSTSVFWGTIWGLLMGFEGCRGTRWGEGAEFQIKFHLFSSRLFCSNYMYLTNFMHKLLSLWDVQFVRYIFLTILTFNLWCMQNLQTPVFMVEESLFSAERGIKPFFGWNETHCTLGNGSAEMLAFPHSTCIVCVRFSTVFLIRFL